MRCPFSFSVIVFLIISGISLQGQNTFKRQIYTPNEICAGESQITTLDHGLLFIGRTYNSITSQQSIILIKTDSLGNMQWSKRIGPIISYSYNIVQSPDSSFLLCYVNSGVYGDDYKLVKMDAVGNVLFSIDVSPSTPNKTLLMVKAFAKNNGSYYLCGSISDSVTGLQYAHVYEINSLGSVLWSNVYNASSNKSKALDLDTCGNGDIIVLGQGMYNLSQHMPVLIRISSTGNLIWAMLYTKPTGEFYADQLEVDSLDYFMVGGSSSPFSANALILRTDELGNPIWTFDYGGPTSGRVPMAVRSTSSTEISVVGTSLSSGFFLKIDTSGLILTSQKYPVSIMSLNQISSVTFAMTGHSPNTNFGFILTTDTNGIGCDDQTESTSKTSVDLGTMPIFGSYALPLMTVPVPFSPLAPNVTFADSCGVLTTTNQIALNNSISIYPSPASEFITINSPDKIQSVEIIDVHGNIVRQKKCSDQNESIYVRDLANGIYFARIYADEQILTGKIIVAH